MTIAAHPPGQLPERVFAAHYYLDSFAMGFGKNTITILFWTLVSLALLYLFVRLGLALLMKRPRAK
jgi:hypothetical protein